MGITGATQLYVGGPTSSGPNEGDYHVAIQDAVTGEWSTGRSYLQLSLVVKDDADHPAKEGKNLTKMRITLAQESDDEDTRKTMNGILKRQAYDGFGVKWPTEQKALDPRIFVGKSAFVRLQKKLNEKDGQEYANVIAVAQTMESMPKAKGTPPAFQAPTNGASKPARARR